MTRLLTKQAICDYLGGISASTYDKWQARGIVPGPIRGTNRYDVRAHDAALDRVSGLDKTTRRPMLSPLEEWEKNHAA